MTLKIDKRHYKSGWFRTMRMTPIQRKQAVDMVLSGVKISEVVKKYGVSRTYIYALLERAKNNIK